MTGNVLSVTGWQIEGQLLEASNAVFRLVRSDDASKTGAVAPRAVYKPVRGEHPLADFPDGTLAHREVAAYLVSAAGGWNCVPPTRWMDGEFGPGSLQQWVGSLDEPVRDRVDLIDVDQAEVDDTVATIAAFDTDDGVAVLVHDRAEDLAEIAAFDIVVNNADRKGSHLLVTEERTWAIDNGLTFHTDDKLRTVLWGWSGEPLPERVVAHLNALQRVRPDLDARLAEHLDPAEIHAFHHRVDTLLATRTFPNPPQDRYGLPWPPL